MNIEILNQGFNIELDNSIGNKIIEILNTKSIKKFTVLTAFSSESIINKLFSYIEKESIKIENIKVITGIDQKGTTKEALLSLLQYTNIDSRVFYSSSNNIFHPKIYLLESDKKTYLIMGSSNLTQQGLFANIESSILLEIENNNERDYDIIIKLKKYYTIIENDDDPNLYVLNDHLINDLVNKKLLPTKLEMIKEIRRSTLEKEISKDAYGKRAVPKIPSFLKTVSSYVRKVIQFRENSEEPNIPSSGTILWTSSPLTERDLNVPKGQNTNVTGDINIDKGDMPDSIDFRHYYRDVAFKNLKWKNSIRKGSEHLEEAIVKFEIFVDGIDKGTYDLKLTHNPKTDTKTYTQKNAMTKLKWGSAKNIVANREYLGKKMIISKTATPGKYRIEIK